MEEKNCTRSANRLKCCWTPAGRETDRGGQQSTRTPDPMRRITGRRIDWDGPGLGGGRGTPRRWWGAGVDHPRGAMDAFLVPINTSPGGRRLAGARRGRLVCLSERGDDIIVEMHARLSRAAAAAAPADAPTHPPRVHRRRRNIYDAVS